jgi:hypothetical protein
MIGFHHVPNQPTNHVHCISYTPSPFVDSLLLMTYFSPKFVPFMVCRNICDRLYSKVVFGISNYSLDQKYCRRCEVYMYNDSMFCPCCGMQLRLTPSSRKCKEILRKRKLLMQKWLTVNGSAFNSK